MTYRMHASRFLSLCLGGLLCFGVAGSSGCSDDGSGEATDGGATKDASAKVDGLTTNPDNNPRDGGSDGAAQDGAVVADGGAQDTSTPKDTAPAVDTAPADLCTGEEGANLLKSKCVTCHGPTPLGNSLHLSTDAALTALTNGKSDKCGKARYLTTDGMGLLQQAVRGPVACLGNMDMKQFGQLSDENVTCIETWAKAHAAR